MTAKTMHALTKDHYEATGPNAVLVTRGELWGRFDRFGVWQEGEIRTCDPQLCIWLTGIFVVNERAAAAANT